MARPRQFDESQVVDAAMKVFWAHGYQGASIQRLVDATGLNRGSLYGTFGDKPALFRAVLRAYHASRLEGIRELLEPAADPIEALRSWIRAVERGCLDENRAALGCLVGNTLSEGAIDDEVQGLLDDFIRCSIRLIADALRRGQALGTFSVDRDPMVVATFVQCGLQGLLVVNRAQVDEQTLRGVVAELLRTLD